MLKDIETVLRSDQQPFPSAVREPRRFSILIPSWNNLPYLRLCLDSLKNNSGFPHQVIVIVNEGADGSLDLVRARPEIDYVHARQNIGICQALNACRKLIRTDYVVYANDDMYFLPGWDRALWEEINRIGHKEFMLSATMIEPGGNNPCAVIADYGREAASFREKDLLADYKSLARADWSGATWPPTVVHLDCWDLVGGLSLEFSPGLYSDPDLSRKLWQIGVRTFIGKGDSLVYHFACKTTGRIKRNNGRKAFLLKWGLSANTFARLYLDRGGAARPALPERSLTLRQRLAQSFRRFISAL
jgi:glycosyltransferase involved in cell wall biosynthesis